MDAARDSDRFDPFSPGFLEDPYSHYARRRGVAPVQWGAPPDPSSAGCWYVLDYASCKAALADERLGMEFHRVMPEPPPPPPAQFQSFFDLIGRWMIFRDPPYHTRMRKLLAPAFSRTAAGNLIPVVQRIAADLLGACDRASVDLIAEFAAPLPIMVIGRMLGIDAADLPALKRWSRALLKGIDLKRDDDFHASLAAATQAATEIKDYLTGLIGVRRRAPSDDLISALVASPDATDEEIVANCALLLFAGHETTVNLIGNGVLALLRHPAQRELLQRDMSLLPAAVEEMARYDSPAQITFRYAMEPVTLGETVLQPGEPVGIVIGSANRDTAQFQDAAMFDIRRTANRHLSFGQGRHMCLGAALARMEAQESIEALLRSYPRMDLAPSTTLSWTPSVGLRGLSQLPVKPGP